MFFGGVEWGSYFGVSQIGANWDERQVISIPKYGTIVKAIIESSKS